MSATIYGLPVIHLDGNGLPRGHEAALKAAAQEFVDFANELPESLYHFGNGDGRDGAERVIHRYLITLRRHA